LTDVSSWNRYLEIGGLSIPLPGSSEDPEPDPVQDADTKDPVKVTISCRESFEVVFSICCCVAFYLGLGLGLTLEGKYFALMTSALLYWIVNCKFNSNARQISNLLPARDALKAVKLAILNRPNMEMRVQCYKFEIKRETITSGKSTKTVQNKEKIPTTLHKKRMDTPNWKDTSDKY
jgi:hypothetical protein